MRTVNLPDGRTRQRLETWGEIATHLGVEIRTAQRWEGRMGLPVRRIDGGQAVFAFADELDDWRTSREVRRAERVAEPVPQLTMSPTAPVEADPERVPTASPRGRNAIYWIAGVFAAAAVGFAAARLSLTRQGAAEPLGASRLVLDHHRLVALDGLDRVVWTHTLARRSVAIDTIFRPNLSSWWERLDVDGDGRDEFIAVLRPDTARSESETLYCFNRDGSLRYAYTPDLTMRFSQRLGYEI